MKLLRNPKVIKLVSTVIALLVVVSLAAGAFSTLQAAEDASSVSSGTASLRESLLTAISSGRAEISKNPSVAGSHPAAATSFDSVLTRCALVAMKSTATLTVVNACGNDVVSAAQNFQKFIPVPLSTVAP